MKEKKDKELFDELQRKKKYKYKHKDDEARRRELDNPAKSSYQSGKKRKKKKQSKKAKKFGMILCVLQAIMSVLFLGVIWKLNVLPTKFNIVLIIVLMLLLLFTYATQRRHKGKATPSKILSIVVIIILALGSFYLGKINGAFDKVVGGTHKIDNMVVAVLTDNPAETIEDAKDYSFAVQYQLGGEDVTQTVDTINEMLGMEINVVEYSDMQAQAAALFEKEVDAIIYNEGYAGMIEETITGFETGIKVIYSNEIEKELVNNSAAEVEVDNNTFNVYLSGIDVYGSIKKTSRSDVNIIATVNTETHQILLTTTPRDYHVVIPDVSKGQKDKLTHAGIYGVDASIATLENLYGIEIPFYARVNFTSIIDIVNALGGIDVYSEYGFQSSFIPSLRVKKGMNHFNGKEALAFSRERYNVPGGDNQRGKNQQAVIVAMIKKMISPQILVSASSIIDSVSDNVETNMSQEQIQELIKNQLNEGGAWSIYSVAAEGTGSSDYTYSMPGTKLYVTVPNQQSVEKIKTLMERVENGEMLEGSEVAQ